MKAYEKFNKRLQELGLYDEWCRQGSCGRVGIETESSIIILCNENERDKFTEFCFPPMRELEQNEEFRKRAMDEFWCHSDLEFVGKLYCWYRNPSNDCPLFPVDVYFCYDTQLYVDFEDDVEEQHEEAETTEEYCPHCDTTVDLEHDFKVQKCPNCGKWLAPCSICPLENCSKHCPLERLACMLNGEE